jgi:cytochrome bd-type quinol oxidase subunit 2
MLIIITTIMPLIYTYQTYFYIVFVEVKAFHKIETWMLLDLQQGTSQ